MNVEDSDAFSAGVRKAVARFATSGVKPGEVDFGPTGQKQGWQLRDDILVQRTIDLTPIRKPEDLSLERNGLAMLDIHAELAAAGITEQNFDPSTKDHRCAVGKVLLAALEQRFDKRAVHLGDTSRVSGGAVYGEATVRDTGSSTLRSAHHGFHLDKFWAGVQELYGCADEEEAVLETIKQYRNVWGEDWRRMGVSEAPAVAALRSNGRAKDGAMVNAWVALTPGTIEQNPLVVADLSSLTVSTDVVATMPVEFPGFSDTITLLKEGVVNGKGGREGARFLWRPSMRFGEVFVFLTAGTPHSAVHLDDVPDKRRQSAEMRVLLLNR